MDNLTSAESADYVAPSRPRVDQAAHGICEAPRLKDVYDSYFELVPVETSAQLEAVHRLRYAVYCVEHPYEDPALNPGSMERDAYDKDSLHALLLHRDSGTPIGTVRLILPWLRDQMDLPIRKVCNHELIRSDNPVLPRARTAEISRLAVSKEFRRRITDRTSVGAFRTTNNDPGRAIINTSFGLMQAIVMMARRAGITHVCAVMEPHLVRMLRKLGIHFVSLGPTVEYHGLRQPCYAELDVLLARAWHERPDVWELIADDGRLWPLNQTVVA